MEEKRNIVSFEEVTDVEINDIWDMFFPKIAEFKESKQTRDPVIQTKPRRYLRFLTM